MYTHKYIPCDCVCSNKPDAQAQFEPSEFAPMLSGFVSVNGAAGGSYVTVEVNGLPGEGPFAFHIHEGMNCGVGTGNMPFEQSGGHYNPTDQMHPQHAGDMPPLFATNGYAYMQFFTGRFTPDEIVNRAVIIHLNPDDFHTQPSGNAGARIACGVFFKVED